METGFDKDAAHRFFAAECFNRAWDLIEKPERSPDEDAEMLQLCLASLWHWSQRPDFGPTNASVGWWQASRVFTLLGEGSMARVAAQRCVEITQAAGLPPFYQGYAYEALARAAPDKAMKAACIAMARQAAAEVEDEAERRQLLNDLDTIR